MSKSLSHTCSFCNKFMSSFLYARLESHSYIVHQDSANTMFNLHKNSVGSFNWKSLTFGCNCTSISDSEFFQLSLWRTFAFASVTFMITTVAFACLQFNKCFFHFIFALACVTFNVVHICKCCLHFSLTFASVISQAWEVSHDVKSGLWFILGGKFGVNGSYLSSRHVLDWFLN